MCCRDAGPTRDGCKGAISVARDRRTKRSLVLIVALCLGIVSVRIAMAEDASDVAAAEIISKENSVDRSTSPDIWQPATVGQKLAWHDRLRTGEDSRAAVRLGDLSILRLDELTEAEVLPPPAATAKPTLDLKQGTAYFFSREKSREINVQTPAANGGIRGTEFVVTVAANGATSFTMIDGEVETSNDNGSLLVRSGERADIAPGRKPAKTNVSHPIDSAQWCFYYPGVLDPKEVIDSLPDPVPLQASLSAYREGNLLMALQQYPRDRSPASPGEKIYRAELFLIAGQIPKAEGLLGKLDKDVPNREALSTLIAAVTLKEKKGATPLKTASEWMAESYYRESQGDLVGARQAAKRATAVDPEFGLAWTRLAEVEFRRDRKSQAKEALEKSLTLAPSNPGAYALRGSILRSEGKLDQAKDSFEKAMALDSALGDAWLGRGLCLIRQGQVKAGRRDLFAAVALEPNRADFRKYLADALDNEPRSSTTQKERARRSQTTESSESPSRGPAQRPGNAATPEPVYLGRLPGSGTNVNPIPTYPTRHPHPGPTKRPSRPQSTSRPERTTDGYTRPGRVSQSPTRSKRPERGKRTRQPTPPPTRRRVVPATSGNQEQTQGRKKRPAPSQSPNPN